MESKRVPTATNIEPKGCQKRAKANKMGAKWNQTERKRDQTSAKSPTNGTDKGTEINETPFETQSRAFVVGPSGPERDLTVTQIATLSKTLLEVTFGEKISKRKKVGTNRLDISENNYLLSRLFKQMLIYRFSAHAGAEYKLFYMLRS